MAWDDDIPQIDTPQDSPTSWGGSDVQSGQYYAPDTLMTQPMSDTSQLGGGGGMGSIWNWLMGGGGGAGGTGGGNQGNLAGLMKLLGLGLGAGGAGAALFGGPGKTQYQTNPTYRGALNQQLPQQQTMFNQGVGMLNNLQQGQIPQGLTNTVQAAYNPFVQQAGQNAIEQSQRAGFALPQDAFTGGPGLRIMGNAMAQLPGMEANTTLQTMFPLISTLMGQGQTGMGNALNMGQQTVQQPSVAQRFGNMGPFLQGIGSILNPPMYNLYANNGGGGIKVAGQDPNA